MVVSRRWTGPIPLVALLLIACSSGDDDEGPRTVRFEFCPGDAPTWMAQQDGRTGTWRRVTPTSATTWDFAFTSDRGGIARAYADDTRSSVWIFLGSTDELVRVAGFRGWRDCDSRSEVNATVAGVPEEHVAIVNLGGRTLQASEGPLLITNVLDGTWPLVAVRANRVGFDDIAERIILRRGISVAGTTTLSPSIDFDNAESFAAATANLTVTSLDPADGEARVRTLLDTDDGGSATLSQVRMSSATNTKTYGAIPTGELGASDLQAFQVQLFGPNRLTYVHFRTVADRSVAVGPVLPTPTIGNAATMPNLRPRVQLPVQPEYSRLVYATFYQRNASRFVEVQATSAYYGTPSSWDVVVPDFTGVDGWDVSWGLDPAHQYESRVVAYGGTRQYFDVPADGDIYRYADGPQPQPVAQDVAPQPFSR